MSPTQPPPLSDDLISSIIIECKVKVRYKNTDIIRELAKRPEIRMQFSVAKASKVPWFEGTVKDWNPLKLRLVYWCSFYSNLDSAYDRPPDRVIENNSMLDRWLENKAKEMSERYESDWAKGSNKIKKSAYDQDEVWEL